MASRSKNIHPHIGKNIREYRKGLHLTQKELAERLFKSESAVRMWELGKSEPDNDTLFHLATIFCVSVDDLLDAYPSEVSGFHTPLFPSNLSPLPQRGMRIIPVYETVSAGFGAQAEDHVIDYLPCFILSESEAEDSIGIKVKGDSMYPKIEDGDIIRVVKQDAVESGQLAVVLVDDEGFVKRVTYGHGFVELQSINPLYPPMRFDGTEAERVRVIGLVRQIIKNV
jgi:repressor LexA